MQITWELTGGSRHASPFVLHQRLHLHPIDVLVREGRALLHLVHHRTNHEPGRVRHMGLCFGKTHVRELTPGDLQSRLHQPSPSARGSCSRARPSPLETGRIYHVTSRGFTPSLSSKTAKNSKLGNLQQETTMSHHTDFPR